MEPLCYSLLPPPKPLCHTSTHKANNNPLRYSSHCNIPWTRKEEPIVKRSHEGTMFGDKVNTMAKLVKEYHKKIEHTMEYGKASSSLSKCKRIVRSSNNCNVRNQSATSYEKFLINENVVNNEYNNGYPQAFTKRIAKCSNESAYAPVKEKTITLTNVISSQEQYSSTNPSSLNNTIISGKKINIGGERPEKYLNLTKEIKKQIILAMLKECKIPMDIISVQEKLIKDSKEDKKLEKLSEAILDSYDVIVQMIGAKETPRTESLPKRNKTKEIKNTNSPQNLLLIKTIAQSNTNKIPEVISEPNHKRIQKCDNGCEKSQEKNIEKKTNIARVIVGVKKEYSINETINMINKYTALTFRNKDGRYDMKTITYLHQKLALGKRFQYAEEFKSRERVSQVKEKLLRVLYSTINKSNDYTYKSTGAPRFFIGRGNNSPLVKALMRERWWWIPADDIQKPYNLLWTQWRTMDFISTLGTFTKPIQGSLIRLSNHFEGNYYLGNKKDMHKCLALYYSLIGKDVSDIVPLTFHIKYGKSDLEYTKFMNVYRNYETLINSSSGEVNNKTYKNVWILKPGENSNRGNGISISDNINEINNYIKDESHTYIIQKYIEHPLLFENRKFDIRCFCLITSVNGNIKAYYYQDGYLRTCSRDYSVDTMAKSVHLTNEAVQIKYDDFGKHEAGNKVSYSEFDKYLENYSHKNNIKPEISLQKNILPKIKVRVFSKYRMQ